MSEHFTAGQLFRHGAAVNGNKWHCFTAAAFMYFLCNGLLATAAFAVNDNTVTSRCYQVNLLQDLFESFAVTKNIITRNNDLLFLFPAVVIDGLFAGGGRRSISGRCL